MLKLSAVFYILAIYVFRFVMYCTVANVGSPGIVSVIRLFSLYSYTLIHLLRQELIGYLNKFCNTIECMGYTKWLRICLS